MYFHISVLSQQEEEEEKTRESPELKDQLAALQPVKNK